MAEQIWYKDPFVLTSSDGWMRFVPTPSMTTVESLNSVVRFSIYFSLILYFSSGNGHYLFAIPLVMITTVVLYILFPNGKTIESFLNKAAISKSYTSPSKANPFMNVLLTEIQDDPQRPDAAPVNRRDVKSEIYKAFQNTSDIYMDTTDLFDQAQAMRTFHTIQSAKVPNDLDGFKQWLSKGLDEPDTSSAFPARHAKILNEGYVAAKGSMRVPSSTSKPTGTKPSGPLPSTAKK
uniref:Minor capsid protein P9 transmembrane helices domain-containing protein n=1 Tax=viral metagenome TaxID=1070528 RepID=A0A6C0JVE0_9ZZZZ